MTENKAAGLFSFTQPIIITNPAFFTPKAYEPVKGKPQGEPKFGARFLIGADHPDFKAFKQAAANAARAKWPGLTAENLKTIKWPWNTGEQLIARRIAKRTKLGQVPSDDHKNDYMKGYTVLKAQSKFAPGLAIFQNGQVVDLEPDTAAWTAAKGQFFDGALALVQINFVAYDPIKEGDRDGVTAYVQKVLSTNKGTRRAGNAPASEAFKGYLGSVSQEDPTDGEDFGGGDEEAF